LIIKCSDGQIEQLAEIVGEEKNKRIQELETKNTELEGEKYKNWKLYVKKRDEVDQLQEENEKIIIEYQTEITRLRNMLKGRCTEEEWEAL